MTIIETSVVHLIPASQGFEIRAGVEESHQGAYAWPYLCCLHHVCNKTATCLREPVPCVVVWLQQGSSEGVQEVGGGGGVTLAQALLGKLGVTWSCSLPCLR